jgi:2'-5' RNA ligase
MRLFVALEIPKQTLVALQALVALLAPICRGARWSRPEGMHLTLKFIGEVSSERAAKLRAELRGAGEFSPLEIAFHGAGFFPNARHPRVFWAGVEAGATLAALTAEIERRLEPLGIARETREFRPHLTLARFKSEEGLPALQTALAKLEKESAPGSAVGLDFGHARYEEFHLIESKLHPQGATYITLETFRFAAAEPGNSATDGARA